MLQPFSPTPPVAHRSIRLKSARLLQLAPSLSADEVDRLPTTIRVGCYDILSYVFSMCTYIFDMGLDIWVAIEHYEHGRMLAFSLTILFVAIPSLIINLISLFWWLDDRLQRNNMGQQMHNEDLTDDFLFKERLQRFSKSAKIKQTKGIEMTDIGENVGRLEPDRNQTLKWAVATVFQIAPLIWHLRALKAAYACMQIQRLPRRERVLYQRFYWKMIEADRDASVLRFFEALLESLPQLLIQGYFLMTDLFWTEMQFELDWKLRVFAMTVSLLSISLSFVSHHRTLRLSLPDKQNLNVMDCNLILFWRFFSILGRFIFLSILIYFNPHSALFLLFIHLLVSTIHITLQQHIQTNTKFDFVDKLMIAINVWIHVFAPFNMSSGQTRSRYAIGYGVEIIEAVTIFFIVNFFSSHEAKTITSQAYVFIWAPLLYSLGLCIMIGYFLCAHPSLSGATNEVITLDYKDSIKHDDEDRK